MNAYSIVVLPGDGIGPEVIDEAVRALKVVQSSGLCQFDLDTIPCAGSYYIEHQREWPEGSLERCKASDAILLGAIGHLDASGKPVRRADGELAGYEQVIGLRMKLDLYMNMRPIQLFPGVLHSISGSYKQVWDAHNINLVVLRENTEGAYTPGAFMLERKDQVETVISPTIITRRGARRVVRRAFELANRREGAPSDGRARVTCVDKSNVVRAHRLFRNMFREIALEYPNIEPDFAYVDAFCHSLVREPERYDVVVAPNLPGDIITDLGSVLQGGMGMAASGNVGDEHAMFEPIHGSAPDITGKRIANPVAAILSVSLMLKWLGQTRKDPEATRAGEAIEESIRQTLVTGEYFPADLGGSTKTDELGSEICNRLQELLA